LAITNVIIAAVGTLFTNFEKVLILEINMGIMYLRGDEQ